jgi:hypothetical protein
MLNKNRPQGCALLIGVRARYNVVSATQAQPTLMIEVHLQKPDRGHLDLKLITQRATEYSS